MTGQQQALVALLAIRGPLGRDHIIDSLWSGRAISASRFANLLAEVRGVVGRERLVQRPDGRYELIDVVTDIDRFRSLVSSVDEAIGKSPDPAAQDAALDRLEEAIGLISGPILDGGHRRYWTWIDDSYDVRSSLEQLVVAAGRTASDLALHVHQPQRARWACERCLSAVPHDERLVATLARIHLAQGRRASAAELVAGWEHAVRRLGLGEPSSGPRNLLVGGPGSLLGR